MQEFNFKQKLLWEEGYMSGSKNIETQTGLVHAMRSNGPLHQVCVYVDVYDSINLVIQGAVNK
jgi:hypothetical protein